MGPYLQLVEYATPRQPVTNRGPVVPGRPPADPRTVAFMRLTKLEHACLILEKDGRKLVVDPGSFTSPLVDLHDVDFVDSAGLGFLIGLSRQVRPHRLRLEGLHGTARQMLVVMGAHHVLDL